MRRRPEAHQYRFAAISVSAPVRQLCRQERGCRSAISQHLLDDLRQRGLPAEKLFHVPNGVDADRLTPLARDEQLANELVPDGGPVFGFFGSFYRYEGVAWLIRAAAELYSRGNRFQLLIIGSGEDAAAISNAVREYGASGYVRVLNPVPHEEIRRYYSIVDVMVFPRLVFHLTEMVTPLKPLEAMSLKKAVLASNVGGHRELLDPRRHGFAVPARGHCRFLCAGRASHLRTRLRQQLGEHGRAMILRDGLEGAGAALPGDLRVRLEASGRHRKIHATIGDWSLQRRTGRSLAPCDHQSGLPNRLYDWLSVSDRCQKADVIFVLAGREYASTLRTEPVAEGLGPHAATQRRAFRDSEFFPVGPALLRHRIWWLSPRAHHLSAGTTS